jgi:hypothetical protein
LPVTVAVKVTLVAGGDGLSELASGHAGCLVDDLNYCGTGNDLCALSPP